MGEIRDQYRRENDFAGRRRDAHIPGGKKSTRKIRVLRSASQYGRKAIAIIGTNPGIDLILMDIDLGDGIDSTQAAQKILEQHDLPLIFLSSNTEREVVEKTEDITSYGYIVKNTGKLFSSPQ